MSSVPSGPTSSGPTSPRPTTFPPTGLAALADEIEVISRVYERRFDVKRTDDWMVLKLQEEMGELVQAYLAHTGRSRDRGRSGEEIAAGFRAEIADVLGQLLLVARRFDVDVEAEVQRKWFRWSHLVEPQDREGIGRAGSDRAGLDQAGTSQAGTD